MLGTSVSFSAALSDKTQEGCMMQGVPDFRAVQEYWLDAWQRSILMLDVLRQRGNTYLEQGAKEVPHVLTFQAELVVDGRELKKPVNYALVRIVPPPGTKIDPEKAPIIVVDPRAGHGPGIGGMKQDSEIGMALAAGHACYFVGFLPKPMPGQTVEDVCRAEAIFIEEVAKRHPDAEAKPIIIANCQAGWQIMMMAAMRPELTGPIMLAGSPLSYWAGVHGKNPLRYVGGMLGGTWLTALAGDLGNGIFDGANLVSNFESLNLANTYWSKPYNLYAKVDTEGERFLDFETWWGNPVLLNAEEMQWIADNLFVGNRLAAGQVRSSDGVRVDLRNIKSPIVVFCSWGDNITPPHQALDWILDLYEHDHEIVANGQTIIYTMHQTIGHLGIFVSGKVATKEHGEFVSAMELIDVMPPGLYEAVITDIDEATENRELIQGRYLFRLEARTLNHIRALGGNDAADDQRFATVARVSEINLGLYRTLIAPTVRAAANAPMAEAMRAMHPNRLRFAMFSDRNPLMQPVKALADTVRASRKPMTAGNPLLEMQQAASSWIISSLEMLNEFRDAMTEAVFLNTYGSPVLQALVGLQAEPTERPRRIERDLAREADTARLRAELEHRFETGHVEAALARALIYIRLPDGSVDERGFAVIKLIRASRPAAKRLSLAQFKELIKEQYLLVCLDEERAIRAIPKLLGPDRDERKAALEVLHRVLVARGELHEESRKRLDRVESLFDAKQPKAVKAEESHV
jgi:pimeloyl-ACP methyl ester carboxylesterase